MVLGALSSRLGMGKLDRFEQGFETADSFGFLFDLVAGRFLDRFQDFIGRERLGNEIHGTAPHGISGAVYGGISADHHHGGLRADLVQLFHHVHAVEFRHLPIAQNNIIAILGRQFETVPGTQRRCHLIPFGRKHFAAGLQHHRVVVDDQQALGHKFVSFADGCFGWRCLPYFGIQASIDPFALDIAQRAGVLFDPNGYRR